MNAPDRQNKSGLPDPAACGCGDEKAQIHLLDRC
jgi:hypothetical protein